RLKQVPGSAYDTRLPWHRGIGRLRAKIETEQAQPQVFYSGYVPFVGAGKLSRSWSFPVALRRANPTASLGEITADGLLRQVCDQVVRQMWSQVPPNRRINGLAVDVRFFGTLLAPRGFDATTAVVPGSTGPADRYGSARKYACISISSWDQELVT